MTEAGVIWMLGGTIGIIVGLLIGHWLGVQATLAKCGGKHD